MFNLAIKERDAGGKEKSIDDERSVLIAGTKGGGKSSIVLKFLERLQDTPKPTTALEYTFGRKPHTNNLGKDIAHIWELGGGLQLAKMMDSVVSATSLRTLSVLIVIDLSRPREIWPVVTGLLDELRGRIDRVLSDLTAKDSRLPTYLRKKAWQRIGESHRDKDIIDPFVVPVVIAGTKYDVFRDLDSEERKIVSKTLRFVAHINGAGLHYLSDRDDALAQKGKQIMTALSFRSSGCAFSKYRLKARNSVVSKALIPIMHGSSVHDLSILTVR